MAKKKQPTYEVLSPDAEGWNELVNHYVDQRNMENQLVIVLITPKKQDNWDVQAFLDERIQQDVSCTISRVRKTSFKQFSFNKDKLYWVIDLATYNPFLHIPDTYQLDE